MLSFFSKKMDSFNDSKLMQIHQHQTSLEIHAGLDPII